MKNYDYDYVSKLSDEACKNFDIPDTKNRIKLRKKKFECINTYIEIYKTLNFYKEEYENIEDENQIEKEDLLKLKGSIVILEGAKTLGEKFFANAFMKNYFKDAKIGYIFDWEK